MPVRDASRRVLDLLDESECLLHKPACQHIHYCVGDQSLVNTLETPAEESTQQPVRTKFGKLAGQEMKGATCHLLPDVGLPEDLPTRVRSNLFAHSEAPTHFSQQAFQSSENGTGQDPGRNFTSAPGNHGLLEHPGGSTPADGMQKGPDVVPAVTRPDDDASGDFPRVWSTQRNGADDATGFQLKIHRVGFRRELNLNIQGLEGGLIGPDKVLRVGIPTAIAPAHAEEGR